MASTSSPAEVESLKRQVSSLSFQLVRLAREHEHELATKDKLHRELVLKRDKRYKKTDQLLADARTEKTDLKRSLNSATAQLNAKTHQVHSLQQEVSTLCGKLDAADARLKHLEQPARSARQPAARPTDGRPRTLRLTRTKSAIKKPPVGWSRLKKLNKAMERHISPSKENATDQQQHTGEQGVSCTLRSTSKPPETPDSPGDRAAPPSDTSQHERHEHEVAGGSTLCVSVDQNNDALAG